MARRRMFSTDIVDSDKFLDMPISARCLYYDLGMRADDDGFISPKKILRLTGATEDDLRVLISKRFIIPFETGVIVIKDWKINNYLRSDRYKGTLFIEEKSKLVEDTNGSYELTSSGIPMVDQRYPQVRLGKVSKDKNIYICSFENFWKLYPKKVAKQKAESIYKKLVTSEKIENNLMQGLQDYLKKWRAEKTDIQYIPNPTTWLNQGRWEDEVQVSNIQFNKNAREFESEWEERKLEEKKKYQSYMVDDGKGGMTKLSDIIQNGSTPLR